MRFTQKTDFVSLWHYGEPCASRGARTVREGASTRRLPHDSYNQSENRGAQTSHGLNYQKLGKELMTQDEIATMDGGRCILQVRGVRPFFSEKYDITRHPRYKYLADADKKNTFDVDRYLSSLRRKRRQVVTEDETFDLYDIDLSDEDFAAE